MHTKLRYLWRFAPSRAVGPIPCQNSCRKSATSYTSSELPLPLLKTDYNKSVEEVYRNLALDYTDRTKSFEILKVVQNDLEDTSTIFKPSWVPR